MCETYNSFEKLNNAVCEESFSPIGAARYKDQKYDIVSRVAFLAGVKDIFFGGEDKNYDIKVFECLS